MTVLKLVFTILQVSYWGKFSQISKLASVEQYTICISAGHHTGAAALRGFGSCGNLGGVRSEESSAMKCTSSVQFPPENMTMFRLMQVLDPSTVHGPTRRSEAVRELLLLFELPWHMPGKVTPEEVANSFTAFRSSEASAEIWDSYVRRQPRDSSISPLAIQ